MSSWKNIVTGDVIPTAINGYCDQPSIVVAKDGSWVGTVTTAKGTEGCTDQHVKIIKSCDRGKSWTKPVRLEPEEEGRYWESSYSKLLVAPDGRIFCFYCYNAEHIDIRGGPVYRYDMGGIFCFRFSDDHGKTWSARIKIPVRDFAIDHWKPLVHQGQELRLFWNVAKPFIWQGKIYVSLTKISNLDGFMAHTEGVLLCSSTALKDPFHAIWETLPDGDTGIRGVVGGGTVAEEHSMVCLSDGTIYSTFRTIDGYAGMAISRDGGHHFAKSQWITDTYGRAMKNSRAANFLWQIASGKYLYWYQNCSYRGYYTRNPAWVCAAIEKGSEDGMKLIWSQPEILLYHESSSVGFSYPDLIIDQGRYFVTETNKITARVHEIPASFIDRLFCQFDIAQVEQSGLIVQTQAHSFQLAQMKPLIKQDVHAGNDAQITTGNGYTFDLWLNGQQSGPLLDLAGHEDRRIRIDAGRDGSVHLLVYDLRECSHVISRTKLLNGQKQHLCIVLDGASRVTSFIVDGCLDDGGSDRMFGWGLISRSVTGLTGQCEGLLGSAVTQFRFYERALATTECIGNYRAELG
ncbi:MAG: sialidase family protein [Bacillota bacterium]|nr:sialidase family protein [Bacillota bacterium]